MARYSIEEAANSTLHAAPELALSSLIPAAVGEKITITKLSTPMLATELSTKYLSKGLVAEETHLGIYGRPTGRVRKSDNSDLISGKENIYDDVTHFIQIYRRLADVRAKWMERAESGGIVGSMELQDLEKWTVQQFKYPGWFLEPPIRDTARPDRIHPLWARALDAVASTYTKAIPRGLLNMSWEELILQDFDPPDTMVGLPTLASGVQTPIARMATLAAYPSPTGLNPDQFLDACDAMLQRLGFEPGQGYSAVLATRFGPMKASKQLPLWQESSVGYVASYLAGGMYNRVRHVFPAAYPMNFLLSPWYVLLAAARQRLLGLWHTPDLMDNYVQRMKKQGKYSFSVDFSAMDMHIMPIHVKAICAALIRHGMPSWPGHLLYSLMDRMGVFYPSFGASGGETYFTGNFGWFSGWKLTAEVDTIFGATTLLATLEYLQPGSIRKWQSGEFVFAESGDDILFTYPTDLDTQEFIDAAIEIAGAELKMFPDAVFLKKMLPVVPEVPVITRLMSRVIQQTFWNEDRYTGIEGGERIPAVMRLALWARTVGISKHPWFKEWWPDVFPILQDLKFMRTASSTFLDSLKQGEPELDEIDKRMILEYSMKQQTFFLRLIDRAKYEPSAAAVVDALHNVVHLDTSVAVQSQLAMRKVLHDKLFQKPTSTDLQRLYDLTTWRL